MNQMDCIPEVVDQMDRIPDVRYESDGSYT